MNWLVISLRWYTMLFILGIIFVPLTKKIFGRFFFEFGYPFAKTLAILLISYSIFVLGVGKILSFTQINIFIVIGLFFLLNFYLIKSNNLNTSKKSISQSPSLPISIIILEELLFLASFIFWVFVRSQEPSIRGLEKFMDFGFINSILRSKYFPPLDMWLSATNDNPAGFPINYYYFGHLVGAFLIKLSGIKPAIGYNLILATVFALGITQTFSLVFNLCFLFLKKTNNFKINLALVVKLCFFGLLGAFIVNLGGNLHTIYVFTKGYPNEQPIPFWQILSGYNPTKYWYPNATRFIPFTIHEFPSYSYVVADLHGHVFDIPFVLLTLAILFKLFILFENKKGFNSEKNQILKIKYKKEKLSLIIKKILNIRYLILNTIFIGFFTAVHYMTNAFDGPIYLLLSLLIFYLLFGLSRSFFYSSLTIIISFIIYSLPFSLNFKPFISGIGVNCSFDFLTKIGRLGPFLFEKGNCQVSPIWMLLILWGFFWIAFTLFLIIKKISNKELDNRQLAINNFILTLFFFGTLLVLIPEFFYIKDIYPAHFRANTMFKLGYQAFIMMGIASSFVFFQIKFLSFPKKLIYNLLAVFFLFFIVIYPLFAIPSYYGNLKRSPLLDGSEWLISFSSADKEIVDYLNFHVKGQPVILEAQGDSYTDYERISANTGLPTVAGWWVHEWLWRGSADFVGKRIPDITNIYQSSDLNLTLALIKKYKIKFIIVSNLEKEKYPQLKINKFTQLGKIIFQSKDKNGAIYQVD